MQTWKVVKNAAILQAMMAYFVIVSGLFAFCDFGDCVTREFRQVEMDFNQLRWYLLPLDVQKDLPTMIALTQRNVFIRGFGSAYCSREIFKAVWIDTHFTNIDIFVRLSSFSDYENEIFLLHGFEAL